MIIRTIRQWLKRQTSSAQKPRRSPRLALEQLEDRVVPTVFVVDSLGDVVDGDFSAGNFTLREAVQEANSTVGDDVITFSAALSGDTISLANGHLRIRDGVSIDGDLNDDGTADITIDAQQQSRIFDVNDGSSSQIVVQMDGLVLTNGEADFEGGAIRNREDLTIRNSTVSNNSVSELDSYGGGISNRGTLSVENSTISNNSVSGDVGGGGGIYDVGTLSVENSTISNNSSSLFGGGIFKESAVSSIATISNSTISGNTAPFAGGGVFNGSGLLKIRNSTITDNQAGSGAGIESVASNSVQTEVVSSIIAGNQGKDVETFGNGNTFVSLGNNLIGTGDQDSLNAFNATGDQTGVLDPGLEALAFNGGPTQTHALKANSLAIDQGSNPDSLATDQRGLNRVVGAAADIGAFERGSTLVVDILGDEDDGDYTTGNLTLREAVLVANQAPDYDAITFSAALSGETILLENGQLSITDGVSIDGDLNDDGTADITIDAQQQSRIFNVDDGSSSQIVVQMDGLVLTNGSGVQGGAIRNREDLTIRNSTVSNNSSAAGGGIWSKGTLVIENSTVSNSNSNSPAIEGGGIFSDGTLVIENSTISNNSGEYGGGIFSVGTLVIENSTISNNSSQFGGGGGGIYSVGILDIENSTISNNSSEFGAGGGVLQTGVGSIGAISNSTISGNTAGSGGGGVFNNDGLLKIRNSTITDNQASSGAGIESNALQGAQTEVVSSIIAGNQGKDVETFGNGSTFVSQGNNLIGTGDQASLNAFNATGDQTGVLDPGLEALAFNGGPTQTHALKANSLAIDQGSNPDSLATDQRGLNRVVGAAADIGAFESQLPTFVVDTLGDENDGDYSTGNLTLREAVFLANESPDVNGITFRSDLSGETILLENGELGLTTAVVIGGDLDNDGTADITIDAQQDSRIFNVDDDSSDEIVVQMDGLILTNGKVRDDGGAILNVEDLTIRNSTVTNSSTRKYRGEGGGIFNEGTLLIENSTVSDNATLKTKGKGGGISNEGTLTIRDSTISGNSTAKSFSGGGGINNEGTLVIETSTVSDNSTAKTFSSGGGIRSIGDLTIVDSTISGNSTSGHFSGGGGIFSFGTLVIETSTINDNSTSGFFSSGGGIKSIGSLTIEDSTISDNSALGRWSHGGGVHTTSRLSGDIATISNSTISGNTARGVGGGVFNNRGLLRITESTITDNEAHCEGSGVASRGSRSTLTEVGDTTIAGNVDDDVALVFGCYNSFESLGDNLIGLGDQVILDAFNVGDDETGVLQP